MVDKPYTTVIVRLDSSTEATTQPVVLEESRKLLVESTGKLLLVKLNYECSYYFCSVDLFMLDEKDNKWFKLMDLGDKVLFLGCDCFFSASTLELCFPKGSCIIFIDQYVLPWNQILNMNHIFHMDQDKLYDESRYPEYLKLFSPLKWIFKF